MAGKSYKYETHTTQSVSGLVQDAVAEAESVYDELTEWRDNMSGTGLESTEKYSQLEEAIDAIETAKDAAENVMDLETVDEEIGEVTYSVSVNKNKRRGPSRQVRIENAASMLMAAAEALRGRETPENDEEDSEDEEDVFDYEGAADELENAASDMEGVEVPGMYG